jgi:hypothetical protein
LKMSKHIQNPNCTFKVPNSDHPQRNFDQNQKYANFRCLVI